MRTWKSTQTILGLLTALSLGIAGAPALAADSYEVKKEQTTVTETKQSTTEEKHHSDAWITTKVKSKLLAHHFLSSLDIKVTTHNGVVQLAGWVKQPEQITEAEKIAGGVVGVKRVQNDLLIKQ
jgi:osmotically-inducible protein OsmY